jgi:serine/threonine protein kinase
MKVNEILEKLTVEERMMADFIKRCLQIDPTKRITCEEAIRHDWFKRLLI